MAKRNRKKQSIAVNDEEFHQYDVHPNKIYYRKRKKRRLKRWVKVLIVLLITVVIAAYIVSPISKVSEIIISGNSIVPTETIRNALSINENSYYLLTNSSDIKSEVEALPFVKSATVVKNAFGEITITVEEHSVMCYTTYNKNTYLGCSSGELVKLTKDLKVSQLKQYPLLSNFKEKKIMKTFVKDYKDVPTTIRANVSEIIYAPKKADNTRVRLMMNNGKELIVRMEDMGSVLSEKRFNYNAYMTEYSEYRTFSFEGDHIYIKK